MKTLLMVLLLVGCVPELPLTGEITISKEFNFNDQAVLLEGIDEWYYATHGTINLQPVITDYNPTVIPFNLSKAAAGTINLHYGEEIKIKIDVEQANKWGILKAVIMHELGHGWLGIDHYHSGLMSINLKDHNNCIDELTLIMFCLKYHCNGMTPTCPSNNG